MNPLSLSLFFFFFFFTPPRHTKYILLSVCTYPTRCMSVHTQWHTNEEIWRESGLIATVRAGPLRRRWVTYGGPEGQNTTIHKTRQHFRKHSNIFTILKRSEWHTQFCVLLLRCMKCCCVLTFRATVVSVFFFFFFAFLCVVGLAATLFISPCLKSMICITKHYRRWCLCCVSGFTSSNLPWNKMCYVNKVPWPWIIFVQHLIFSLFSLTVSEVWAQHESVSFIPPKRADWKRIASLQTWHQCFLLFT